MEKVKMVLVYINKFKASLGYVENLSFKGREGRGGRRKKCSRECRSLGKTVRILGVTSGQSATLSSHKPFSSP